MMPGAEEQALDVVAPVEIERQVDDLRRAEPRPRACRSNGG